MKITLDRQTIEKILCDHISKHANARDLFSAGGGGEWKMESLSNKQAILAFKTDPRGATEISTPKAPSTTVTDEAVTKRVTPAPVVEEDGESELEDPDKIEDAKPFGGTTGIHT